MSVFENVWVWLIIGVSVVMIKAGLYYWQRFSDTPKKKHKGIELFFAGIVILVITFLVIGLNDSLTFF